MKSMSRVGVVAVQRGLWTACVAGALAACALGGGSARAAWQAPANPAQRGIDLYNQGRHAEAEAALKDQTGADADAYRAASIAKQASLDEVVDRRAPRYAEAEALARKALAVAPAQRVAAQALGEALVGLSRTDEAVSALSAVLALDKEAAYAYYWRGKAYNMRRETARMMDDFRIFLKLQPTAPEAPAVQALLAALR